MHAAGEWMLSYRYGRMRMNGNRSGTRRLSSGQVLAQGFGATPVDMDMEMHMFGLMGAPTNWLTAAVMLPYVRNAMDHLELLKDEPDLGSANQGTCAIPKRRNVGVI